MAHDPLGLHAHSDGARFLVGFWLPDTRRLYVRGLVWILPAQCGEGGQVRETYGHLLVGGAWVEDLANGGEEAGFIIANTGPGLTGGARVKIPPLQNDWKYRPA